MTIDFKNFKWYMCIYICFVDNCRVGVLVCFGHFTVRFGRTDFFSDFDS